MSTNVKIKALDREKGIKAATLRKEGKIPALIYNHGQTKEITVEKKDVHSVFSKGVSESTLIEMDIGGTNETVFVKDFQVHPVSEEILHVDFYRITYGEKVKTHIPLRLVGKPAGVIEGGVLETFLHDIEVEILPKDLMPHLDVDVSALHIGDALHVEDLKLPGETKILTEGNPIICHVSKTAKLAAEKTEEETEEESAEEVEEKE